MGLVLFPFTTFLVSISSGPSSSGKKVSGAGSVDISGMPGSKMNGFRFRDFGSDVRYRVTSSSRALIEICSILSVSAQSMTVGLDLR